MTQSTDEMPAIPRPQVLDPQRIDRDDREDLTLEDHRSRAQLLGTALDETSGYATTLGGTAAAMRTYLHEHTPIDPRDEAGWVAWQDAYAAIVSVLCGPRGDSGFGAQQAQVIAQLRQAAQQVDGEHGSGS